MSTCRWLWWATTFYIDRAGAVVMVLFFWFHAFLYILGRGPVV